MTLPDDLGDPTPHLLRPGALSAAPPDTDTYPLTLATVLAPGPATAICVVTPSTRAVLEHHFDVIDAAPSRAADLATPGSLQRAVVEEAALDTGPWLGAIDGDLNLLDSLCDLLAAVEANGGTSVVIPAAPTTAAGARLASAAGVALPLEADNPSLAEGFPLPPWLTELDAHAKAGGHGAS